MTIRTIKEEWKTEALNSAKMRRNFHESFGSKKHWSDPNKGEYDDEYYGSLGQIVFRERVKELGLEKLAKYAPLFTSNLKELPSWDANIEGCEIEIKTIPPDDVKARTRMLVKVSEAKKVDVYVAIKFVSPTEYKFCGYATSEEVRKQTPVNFGFAPAYAIKLEEMPNKLIGRWWEQFKKC